MAGLARAQIRLKDAGFALDVPLKAVQQASRGAQKFSIPGGQSRDGTANVVTYSVLKSTVDPSTPRGPLLNPETGLTAEGYVVNFGSSFVMALEIGKDGPRGQAFLSYSESDDPASPYFSDQTALFEAKQWRSLVFSEADIAADPALRTLEVAGGE
jgi:acyl-homoserine-lactone acylase